MKLLKSENDVIELAGRIQNAMPSIDSAEQMDKATEYMLMSIMGRQISMYDGLITKKKAQLDDAVVKLQLELEGHTKGASEVKDSRVTRATDWVRQQEEQLTFLTHYVEKDMEKAKDAYQSFFGKSWMPYSASRNVAAANCQTAARAEAEELLKKYTG